MFGKIQKFVSEVTVELKKVSWSTRSELIDSTKVVLLSIVILGVIIAGIDFTLAKFIAIIIR